MSVRSLIKRLLPPAARRMVYPSRLRIWMEGRAMRRRHPSCIISARATVDRSTLGDRTLIDKDTWISHSNLGRRSYVAEGASVAYTDMGNFCSVAPRAYVGLPQHPSRGFVSTHPAFYEAIPERHLDIADRNYFQGFVPTSVGNDVWIGAGALIRGGVKIGDGAIVGAGAVVTRDVDPYAVVVGTPARLLRYRFAPEEIAFLIDFRWWDRDDEWLRLHFREFHDAASFLRRYGSNGVASVVSV